MQSCALVAREVPSEAPINSRKGIKFRDIRIQRNNFPGGVASEGNRFVRGAALGQFGLLFRMA